jgi:hypothetical protein
MGNLTIYKTLATPPAGATKPIAAGRLKGKSDINPQWRIEAMTEVFGICGIGWKYSIDRLWTEAGSDNQVMAFALVSLYVKLDGEWSEAIPGIGGNMIVAVERSGLHTSDEGFKMAVTDALSVAMKFVGVAADVYRGVFDTKYNAPAPQQQNPAQPAGKPSMNETTFNQLCSRLYAEGEELLEKAKKAYTLNADQLNKAEIILDERETQ